VCARTVHQFIQIGLVIENPDDPARPINSPKTRYIIESKTLELIRTYGTQNWNDLLNEYVRSAPSLAALQVRERVMPMIPVTLPDGENILLTSGGQNSHIKKIIGNCSGPCEKAPNLWYLRVLRTRKYLKFGTFLCMAEQLRSLRNFALDSHQVEK
jgi:hypothetical protein